LLRRAVRSVTLGTPADDQPRRLFFVCFNLSLHTEMNLPYDFSNAFSARIKDLLCTARISPANRAGPTIEPHRCPFSPGRFEGLCAPFC